MTQSASFLSDAPLDLRLMDVARVFFLAQIFVVHYLSSLVHLLFQVESSLIDSSLSRFAFYFDSIIIIILLINGLLILESHKDYQKQENKAHCEAFSGA